MTWGDWEICGREGGGARKLRSYCGRVSYSAAGHRLTRRVDARKLLILEVRENYTLFDWYIRAGFKQRERSRPDEKGIETLRG